MTSSPSPAAIQVHGPETGTLQGRAMGAMDGLCMRRSAPTAAARLAP